MDRAGPQRDLPEHDGTTERVAEGRPEGICAQTYGDTALKLRDMGYEPLPIQPHSKRPAVDAWTSVQIDEAQVAAWGRRFGSCGIGLRTGHLVAVDIDILDPDLAHQAAAITRHRLGDTLVRVGHWPKRLMLYRTLTPMPKRKIGKVEVLGQGQQFVAFGIHPDTSRPYDWPGGDSPLDWRMDALPLVDEAVIEALLAELEPLTGPATSGSRAKAEGATSEAPTRDTHGLVIDGRDAWLSTIAFHAVHDAIEHGEPLDELGIATKVWARFCETAALDRPKQGGSQPYGPGDGLKKVRDKLRLFKDGRLPARHLAAVVPDHALPMEDVVQARHKLADLLTDHMSAVEDWLIEGGSTAAPRLGIRATVGLGKSSVSRAKIAAMCARLQAQGLPARILNFAASHALAEETAAAWRAIGRQAAVLRGYEAHHPTSREPMCRDLDAVRAAVAARVDIQSSACLRHSQHCPHISTCLKQKNRQEVAAAEVVVAAYDAMFTGFAGDMTAFALVVIDEGFWQRSWQDAPGLSIEGLPGLGIGAVGTGRKRDKMGAAQADVIAMREKLARALIANGPGPLRREPLDAEGITLADCRDAKGREWQAMPDLRLKPGQPAPERRIALVRALDVAGRRRVIDLWSAVEALLADGGKGSGRIRIDGSDGRTGLRPIRLFERKSIAEDIARRPILHLDATLRPELVEPFLSTLQIETIDARAPHQHLRLIAGSFGKANLCDDPHIPTEERARRSNRLQGCVDHVRWHALRHRGRRCLVITYKDCEDAFAAIPGVETAHFNAIAGLDAYGGVTALFVIGRPLPQAAQLAAPIGALYGTAVTGNYHKVSSGIWLPGGKQTAITVRRHADARAEVLRAAICDDEVLQAVGRGRGINRRVDDPLEVHVLADVVLPLEHALVQAWSAIVPDIVQRMLLAGIAVDSPADAARLHPGLFENEEQAKKAFQRGLFGGHSPIRDIYREMSLKSAGYRRLGRGRGWQRAWWIEGTEAEARVWLEAAVGPLAEWDPL